jgi:hypothetical protein
MCVTPIATAPLAASPAEVAESVAAGMDDRRLLLRKGKNVVQDRLLVEFAEEAK